MGIRVFEHCIIMLSKWGKCKGRSMGVGTVKMDTNPFHQHNIPSLPNSLNFNFSLSSLVTKVKSLLCFLLSSWTEAEGCKWIGYGKDNNFIVFIFIIIFRI
jgi:hypothetical protein